MPISKETARKGGRARASAMWADKDPSTVRNKQMKVTISQDEYDEISAKSEALGLSKADLVVNAVRVYLTALIHDEGHTNN